MKLLVRRFNFSSTVKPYAYATAGGYAKYHILNHEYRVYNIDARLIQGWELHTTGG